MAILATKNGINRNFSETQWNNMPKDKYGWTPISQKASTKNVPIPTEIIQKKMEAGATAKEIKPAEIVKTEKLSEELPEELISKPKKPGRGKK